MLRRLENEELKDLYDNHIAKDFPKNERPPYEMMLKQLENGIQEGYLLFNENDEALGYSIATTAAKTGYVLISLFAAISGNRGKGIGSALMNALLEQYQNTKGVFVEVEKPEQGKDEDEKNLRTRRICFYERLGYRLLPSIDYCLFSVPMYIMVHPLQAELESNEFYANCLKEIYDELLPPNLLHRFQISIKKDNSK